MLTIDPLTGICLMDESQASVADILTNQGILTKDQLSQIKLESINSNTPQEKILHDRALASPAQIAQAKAQIMGIPYIELEGMDSAGISPEILNLIPEQVARRYKLIPFKAEGDVLSVAMADPLDLQVTQFLEKKTNHRVKRYYALEEDIQKSIYNQYSQNLTTDVESALKEVAIQSSEDKKTSDLDQTEVIREAPVANIVTQLLEYAVKSKSSDIHIEPEENQTRVRYRIDGILHEKILLPKKVHDAVISRIKIMANLKIDERRLPQDGRFSFNARNISFDLRVSSLPTVFGEKVVMRLLPKADTPPTLQDLGLRATALETLEMQLTRTHGIILICGPTGSGKTTTYIQFFPDFQPLK